MPNPEFPITNAHPKASEQKVAMCSAHGIDREVSAETAAAIVTRARGLPNYLYELTDEKTGLLTRAPLLSSYGIAELNARLGFGPKYMALLDLNHVNIADKFGLGKNVDDYFSSLQKIADKFCAPNPFSLLRIGGDEIIVLIADGATKDGFEKLKAFIAGMESLRHEKFSRGEATSVISKLADATRDLIDTTDPLAYLGALRTMMRIIRIEHKNGCRDSGVAITEQNFDSALRSRLTEEGIQTQEKQTTGEMQLALALKLLRGETEHRSRVMTASAAVVASSGNLSWKSLHIMFSTIDLELHRRKFGGKDGSDDLQWQLPDASLREKASARDEMKSFQEREEKYLRAREVLNAGGLDDTAVSSCHMALQLACEDPSTSGVARTHLARNFTARELFLVERPTTFNRLDIDVPGWGIINHVAGYTKADGLFRKISEVCIEELPGSHVLRSQGGGLTILNEAEIPHETRRNIQQRIQKLVSDLVSNEKFVEEIKIEESEKAALKALYDGFLGKSSPILPALGSVQCVVRKQVVTPEMTIEEIASFG